MEDQNEGAGVKPAMAGKAAGLGKLPETLFSALLAELKQPAKPAPAPVETSRVVVHAAAVESMGHLQKKIESLWDSPDLDVFISSLFIDSRDGARKGLPREVADEVLFLADINKMIRARDAAKRLKVSLAEAYRLVDQGDQARLEAAQRRMVQQARPVPASRREQAVDGFGNGLWRGPLGLVRGKTVVFLVISAVGAMLSWPKTFLGFLPAF